MTVLSNANALNIFTDASLINTEYGYITCSGAIAVSDITTPSPTVLDRTFMINAHSTNNHGELLAILYGVELAMKNKYLFSQINLFSDSRRSVFGLRDWCSKWFNNTVSDPYGVIVSSSGAPVSNQDIIKCIIRTIVFSDLKINLYHQSGHVDPTNPREVNECIRVFNSNNFYDYDNNHIDLDYREAALISLFNNMVDSISRSYLDSIDRSKQYNKRISPIQYGMTLDLFNNYKSLINLKGGSK